VKIKFNLLISLLTVVCALGIGAWNQYAPVSLQVRSLWFILALFVSVTVITHQLLMKAALKDPNGFVRTFLASTSIKLFLFLVFLVGFCLFNKSQAVPFIICFLAHYLLFTTFEVYILLKHFKKQS